MKNLPLEFYKFEELMTTIEKEKLNSAKREEPEKDIISVLTDEEPRKETKQNE